MYFLYILNSLDKKHWYIGSSSNIELRLLQHNLGKTRSTRPYRPWQMVYFEDFQTKSDAYKREYFLKSPSGYLEYLAIKKIIMERSDSGSFHRPGKSAL